jgi:hypothetical protein
MLTGEAPFKAKESKIIYQKILTAKIVLPSWLSPDCKSFLRSLLERNVENRLGARKSTMFHIGGVSEIKAHPFFKVESRHDPVDSYTHVVVVTD